MDFSLGHNNQVWPFPTLWHNDDMACGAAVACGTEVGMWYSSDMCSKMGELLPLPHNRTEILSEHLPPKLNYRFTSVVAAVETLSKHVGL